MQALLGMLCVMALALAPVAKADTPLAADPQYAAIGRISGPSGVAAWDYATIDPARGWLFLATLRSSGRTGYAGDITAFDLRTHTVLPARIEVGMPHKVVVLGRGLIAVADASTNSVDFFNESTGRPVGRVPTGRPPDRGGWHNPDSLVRAPGTGLLIAVDHDTGTLVLINAVAREVVGRVQIGGILEEAAAEGNGTVLVNDSSRAKITVVNVPAKRVIRRISLKSCEEPTGIVYDSADRVVVSVCDNGWAKFVDPESGIELASIGVGKGADGVMYDTRRKAVIIAAGESGTLSVIRLESRHDIHLVQTLRVPPGTRLGAVDVATGRVYLPTAGHDMRGPPLRLPGLPPIPRVVPGTFGLLVLGPISAQ